MACSEVTAPLAVSPGRGRSNPGEEAMAGNEPNPQGTELLIPAATTDMRRSEKSLPDSANLAWNHPADDGCLWVSL